MLKYFYEQDGKVNSTVAGMSKLSSKVLDSLEDVYIGKEFTADISGRTAAHYIDDNSGTVIIDRDGKTYEDKNPYSIYIEQVPYTLGITNPYEMYILNRSSNSHE